MSEFIEDLRRRLADSTYEEGRALIERAAAVAEGDDWLEFVFTGGVVSEFEDQHADHPAEIARRERIARNNAKAAQRYQAWLESYHRSESGRRYLLESAELAAAAGRAEEFARLTARLREVQP